MKRTDIVPNYREQKVTIAMICGEAPCCGLCQCSLKWGTSKKKMYCRILTYRNGQRMIRKNRVYTYAVCDRFTWRKINVNARPVLGSVRVVRDEGSPPKELEVQAQHGGDSVEASSTNAARRDERPASTRLGASNPLRISPEQEDKTLVVAIPQ